MSIPLSVLVQALEALEAVNDFDMQSLLPNTLWRKVVDARAGLAAVVRPLTVEIRVEVDA